MPFNGVRPWSAAATPPVRRTNNSPAPGLAEQTDPQRSIPIRSASWRRSSCRLASRRPPPGRRVSASSQGKHSAQGLFARSGTCSRQFHLPAAGDRAWCTFSSVFRFMWGTPRKHRHYCQAGQAPGPLCVERPAHPVQDPSLGCHDVAHARIALHMGVGEAVEPT